MGDAHARARLPPHPPPPPGGGDRRESRAMEQAPGRGIGVPDAKVVRRAQAERLAASAALASHPEFAAMRA